MAKLLCSDIQQSMLGDLQDSDDVASGITTTATGVSQRDMPPDLAADHRAEDMIGSFSGEGKAEHCLSP